ncbi:disulfide bond formation protein B [Pelagibacterales bacterium SAG-MED19]|nr:disulfide bond formation protein B [Pelagibacterales bacterium SAG-MED19]
MPNLKINFYLKIIFLISLISFFSAFFIEYALGYQPCNLCLIERIPYGLSIILIILNYLLRKNEQFIIMLLILIFSFSFILSFYHFGIEQGFFEESAVCGLKKTSEILSKEELLNQLKIRTVSCKDVTFRIFGFSLTTFNIFISLILVIFLIKIFNNYEKFKK